MMLMITLGLTMIWIRIGILHAYTLDIILMILSAASTAVIAVLRAKASLVLTGMGNG